MPPTSAGPCPPSPLAPWQAAHLAAKTVAPCAGVPEPTGRPTPSGAMEMSQAFKSPSEIGLPSFGISAAEVTPAPIPSAAASAKILRIDMGDRSLGIDAPARNRVHMRHREGDHRRRVARGAALGD